MTYFDFLKNEIIHRYLGYLFTGVIFGIGCYFSKAVNASLLNAALSASALAIGTLVLVAYIKYRKHKK